MVPHYGFPPVGFLLGQSGETYPLFTTQSEVSVNHNQPSGSTPRKNAKKRARGGCKLSGPCQTAIVIYVIWKLAFPRVKRSEPWCCGSVRSMIHVNNLTK